MNYQNGDLVWYVASPYADAVCPHTGWELVRVDDHQPHNGGYIVTGVVNGVRGGVGYGQISRSATPEEVAQYQLTKGGL